MSYPRREFLHGALGCTGYLLSGLALAPAASLRAFAATPRERVVAEEVFARIEQVATDDLSLVRPATTEIYVIERR